LGYATVLVKHPCCNAWDATLVTQSYIGRELVTCSMAQNSLTDDDLEKLQNILEQNKRCGVNQYTGVNNNDD